MSGDLGNLLTGEVGEAEARFSHEDFAADFGQRIAGRVRRRRAVRAAGVGGGTMLTAGALAVGAMNIPWGVLGAAPGVGGSDCVTTAPTDGANLVTVTFGGSDRPSAAMTVTDPVTGGVRLTGVEKADGTWVFTDADGNPVEATRVANGSYEVQLGDATAEVVVLMPSASQSPPDPSTAGSFTYTYTVDAAEGAASPSASNDCYTPSPTPSPAPSISTEIHYTAEATLAAKPDDVIGDSPFECGFEFPTESFGTETQSIDGTQWMTGADAAAAIRASFTDDPSQAPGVGSPTGLVPVVTVHFAGTVTDSGATAYFGIAEPSIDQIDTTRPTDTTDLYASEGATFVGVADGRVVATGVVPADGLGTPPPVYMETGAFPEDGALLYLLDQAAALISCDANPVDAASIDLFAVAGLIVKQPDGTVVGPTYAWIPVGKP